MKKLLAALALLGLAAAAPAAFAADVAVSVQFGQPGVYGRVDIGRYVHPEVVVQRPVVVRRRPVVRGPVVVVAPQPVYLWVPPVQQQQWSRYCGRYEACGVPVYFVKDRWYRDRGPGRDWRQEHRHDRRDRDHGWGRNPR